VKDLYKYKLENQIADRLFRRRQPRHGNWYLVNNIRVLRKVRGMSQDDLAKKISVSRQTISSIERYKSDPQLSLGIAIAEALDVQLEHVFSIRPFPAAPWRKNPWVGTEHEKRRWRRMINFTN
jgi:putative transcriptional regulator